jgi:uncharacterized protein (DUF58 family)
MSWPGSTTRRNRAFPLTWRGIFFGVVSSGLLLFGILRIELAALLWGSAFFLLVLYTLGGNHFCCWLIRRHLATRLEAVDCTLPARGLFPAPAGSGTEAAPADSGAASAVVRVELPARLPPGLRVAFNLTLSWQEREPIRLRAPLNPGRNEQRLGFRTDKRGLYKSRRAGLEVTDLLGYTRSVLEVPLTEQVRVLPALRPAPEWEDLGEEGGEEVEKLVRLKRSQELLEVRPYLPGDDLRKINWKLFAHLDELFIRLGEETPPPESRFLVLLDTSPVGGLPAELAADYLDGLVEACAAAANLLLLRGVHLTFTRCGGVSLRNFGLETREQLLADLAEAWWSPAEDLLLPARKSMQVLVFSTPASSGLEGILKTLRSRNWGVSLFLKRLVYSPSAQERKPWERLLFRPREPAAGERRGLEAEVEAFNANLAWSRSRYRRAPWRVSYVAEV